MTLKKLFPTKPQKKPIETFDIHYPRTLSEQVMDFVWTLIIAIGITLLGSGTGILLYYTLESPAMKRLAACTGIVISIAVALFVSAKLEQRREKEIQLAKEKIKKEYPSRKNEE
jgi:hypothetical protein